MDAEASVVAPASLEAGQVVDGFRLDEVAHRGGMATLWHVSRVAPVADDPPLVMKVPRVRGGEDPAAIVGFEVEQMVMPALAGPHVPRFIAKGDFTRVPYIVMERIEGPSLRARFDVAPLAIDEIQRIGAKVATALHDLHRQRVVHLDVKPSNIVFRRGDDGSEGDAVLIDFGLSHHDLLPDLLEEEFDLPMGTSPYMSPEQVRFVRNDPRSDLFSTGVMLYHLTTGARPFGMPSSVRGLRRRLYRDPVAPRTLRPDCPPWLQEIILRCLEVRPERRYQSASQLAFDLLHPEAVALTSRATRSGSGSTVRTMKRWLASLAERDEVPGGVAATSARSPIVLAAVDVAGAEPALLESVREAALRLLKSEPGARLACLTVMRIHRIGMDDLLEADGTSRHVKLLVELRHWARPLLHAAGLAHGDAASRITYHVLEAPDPAAAVVEYARRNQVDHIVLGARSSGRLRRHLGSVSARVAAEADCTVTVVRASDGER
ncbi:MAG TPA: bifunctional serine/threonine-protein kinase/universal stress protein [Caldimonas sp.]|nr:bifunctional serine/threonine-protein kinase/universal stress protein [Caldimonas sp.]